MVTIIGIEIIGIGIGIGSQQDSLNRLEITPRIEERMPRCMLYGCLVDVEKRRKKNRNSGNFPWRAFLESSEKPFVKYEPPILQSYRAVVLPYL